jgi:hypothetical protein
MMQHIVVEVQDQEKADLLVEFLNALDFITFISTENVKDGNMQQRTVKDRTQEFFSYAGLWAERDISITSIRQQAWPRHS